MKLLSELSNEYSKLLEERLDWGMLATFTPNKNDPIHRWFYYKEGFAKELVIKLLEKFGVSDGGWVLDPFCGSGTTLLACKQIGINSIGLDVLPISVFASEVKTRDYNTAALREAARDLLRQKFYRQKIHLIFPPMKRLFSPYALEDCLFFKDKIEKIEDETIKNFLLLGLIKAAMRVSWVWKDGAVLKVKKQDSSKMPLRKMLKNVLKQMIKDLENLESQRTGSSLQTIVSIGDARNIEGVEDEKFDAVITSPPYLNNIDYTKVYSIENWFVKDIIKQETGVRSFIGMEDKQTEFLEDYDMPPQARTYFYDMNQVLKELHRVCKPGANVAIVIGNAYLNEQVIESDIILAHLAEQIGFKIEKILVLNKRAALVERTKKVGTLRESLIILKK